MLRLFRLPRPSIAAAAVLVGALAAGAGFAPTPGQPAGAPPVPRKHKSTEADAGFGPWTEPLGPNKSTSITFVIKAVVDDSSAKTFVFNAQKTMYGGKHISKGDPIFVFASENQGGPGLIASGIVTSAQSIAKKAGIARQTPRVSITIKRTAPAKRQLGRSELKPFCNWNDGRPETELNFKLYRQATNKIVGISDAAARFLHKLF